MNEASDNGRQPNEFLDRWTNNEIPIEMGPEHTQPPRPITGKRLEQLKAERARWAKLARENPHFHAELERYGIHLTAEELQEPPATGNAETAPS